METARRWATFAGLREGPNGPEFANFGHPRMVEMYGLDPTPVWLVEDPDGPLLGWIDNGKDADTPVMVEHHRIFAIQFPYGPEAAVQAGDGTVVRLRAEAQDETDSPVLVDPSG